MRILIVDDNADSLQGLKVVLTDLGHEPEPVTDARQALNRIDDVYFPLVITDIRMPGMDGLELLAKLKDTPGSRDCDVVIITGHGDMETAIDALRKGAYDYLNKPINARELAAVVERSAEHQALILENRQWRTSFSSRLDEAAQDLRQDLERARTRLRKVAGIGAVVAVSPAMARLLKDARIYHDSPSSSVLIEGETGTGKEILARLVHFGERGTDEPFVPINCSAIPERLFESELFGHDPGAYTGSARSGAPGKLEIAGKGTLFLDEVAEMPLEMQPKLLRVLEDRTFYRVGGVKKRRFQARVVCAANQDLENLMEQGLFRRDLFHRLNVGRMRIPPLRERIEDIEPLAQHFLLREARRKKRRFRKLAPETIQLLQAHAWPGNVRELENAVERAVLTCDDDVLRPGHLAFLVRDETPRIGARREQVFSLDSLALPEAGLDLEALNQAIVRKALDRFGGNKTRTAKYLGMSRYALHRRLEKS